MHSIKLWLKVISTFCLYCFAMSAQADISIATISDNLLGPTQGFAKFISAIALVLGTGLLIGAVIQFREHKKNPTQVKFSTPVVLLLLGIVLTGLPFLAKYSASSQYLAEQIEEMGKNVVTQSEAINRYGSV